MAKPKITFYRIGIQEGRTVYSRRADGGEQPWRTRREASAEAKREGGTATFQEPAQAPPATRKFYVLEVTNGDGSRDTFAGLHIDHAVEAAMLDGTQTDLWWWTVQAPDAGAARLMTSEKRDQLDLSE